MPAKKADPPKNSVEVLALIAAEVVKANPNDLVLRNLQLLLENFEQEASRTRKAVAGDSFKAEFEQTVREGLKSKDIRERETAMKLAGDIHNPTIADAKAAAKKAEDARVAAETALAVAEGLLEAKDGYIELIRPLVERLPAVQAELAELKATFNQRVADRRTELLAEAAQRLSRAEAAEREASHKLQLVEANYTKGALLETFDLLRTLVESASIPMPDFWSASPNLVPAFWTLWGWSPAKARVYVSYRKSFPELTDGFKQHALSMMIAALPKFDQAMPETESRIDNFAERLECLREMCVRWNVLDEITKRVEAENMARAGLHLRHHNASMQSQEAEMARLGMGREPIAIQPETTSTVPLSEHVLGCCCVACGGMGLPDHLREDPWLGTKQEIPEADLNEPNREVLEISSSVIEREERAKKGNR